MFLLFIHLMHIKSLEIITGIRNNSIFVIILRFVAEQLLQIFSAWSFKKKGAHLFDNWYVCFDLMIDIYISFFYYVWSVEYTYTYRYFPSFKYGIFKFINVPSLENTTKQIILGNKESRQLWIAAGMHMIIIVNNTNFVQYWDQSQNAMCSQHGNCRSLEPLPILVAI